MSNKSSMGNFDLNELKERMQEVKGAIEQAKAEQEANGGEAAIPKQSLGQKIIGIFLLIVLLVGCGWALISNIDLMFLPKNSITIVVENESGEHLEGVSINLLNTTGIYNHTHTDVDNLTLLDMHPGKYILTFKEIPEGYTVDRLVDNLTLEQGGKVKVEYTCKQK